MQNMGYYSKFISKLADENADMAEYTCFPVFLITLQGISIVVL
jgi:hypothetical protein